VDGLRSIAILAVLAYHCDFRGFAGGYVGVDIFFAISGYLICGLIVRDLDRGTFSISNFYKKRCKRILPALFAVLLFVLLTALLITSPYEAHLIGKYVMAVSASVSNILFYLQGSYFFGGNAVNPLLMTWSLAVEEQFYIAFPLLMILLYRTSKRGLFAALGTLCVLSLGASVYMEFRHPEFNFYSPVTRAWELGTGAMLALYEARRRSIFLTSALRQNVASWTGLVLVLCTITLYTPSVRFPGYEAIPPVLGTLLLLANRRGGANRILATRPFVAIGLLSYSLYLWHWPLLSYAALISPVPLTVRNRLLLIGFTFVAAIASYFLIEQPFRTPTKRANWKIISAYACGSICFLTMGSILFFTGGIPQRARALAEAERSADIDRPHACMARHDFELNLSPQCVPAVSATPKIALLGDSHAEALEGSLKSYAEGHGIQVLTLTKPSCPPLHGATRFAENEPLFASQCERFNDGVLAYLKTRPDVKAVVLAGSWPMAPEDAFLPTDFAGDITKASGEDRARALVQGIRAEADALEAMQKSVIVVDDNPSMQMNPLNVLRYAALPVRRMLVDRVLGHAIEDPLATSVNRAAIIAPQAEEVRTQLMILAEQDPKLAVIDTKSLLCDQARCAIAGEGYLYYTDNNHLSTFAESKVAASIGEAIKSKGFGLLN
jgi:peptidoglycan/LPS O-acetylase OafA/YrhL